MYKTSLVVRDKTRAPVGKLQQAEQSREVKAGVVYRAETGHAESIPFSIPFSPEPSPDPQALMFESDWGLLLVSILR